MPPKVKQRVSRAPAKPTFKTAPKRPFAQDIDAIVAELKRLGTKKTRDGMACYAIPSDNAFGVPVGVIRDLGKRPRKGGDEARNHELALGLWQSGWYEARMLCSFIDEPALVTPAQMDRWRGDFDNWAIVDTVCFHLFDKTQHAFAKVAQWCEEGRRSRSDGRRARGAQRAEYDEFATRAPFALLWGLTVHDKRAGDEAFIRCLPYIERTATDERNFVKKAVNMALRAIGKRSPGLRIAALAAARRLADSADATSRWVGKDALRELAGPSVARRLAAKRRTAAGR